MSGENRQKKREKNAPSKRRQELASLIRPIVPQLLTRLPTLQPSKLETPLKLGHSCRFLLRKVREATQSILPNDSRLQRRNNFIDRASLVERFAIWCVCSRSDEGGVEAERGGERSTGQRGNGGGVEGVEEGEEEDEDEGEEPKELAVGEGSRCLCSDDGAIVETGGLGTRRKRRGD
jgi:hypothetical protein